MEYLLVFFTPIHYFPCSIIFFCEISLDVGADGLVYIKSSHRCPHWHCPKNSRKCRGRMCFDDNNSKWKLLRSHINPEWTHSANYSTWKRAGSLYAIRGSTGHLLRRKLSRVQPRSIWFLSTASNETSIVERWGRWSGSYEITRRSAVACCWVLFCAFASGCAVSVRKQEFHQKT